MRPRANIGRQKQVLQQLALYFAEHGLPLNYEKFKSDSKKPITDRQLVLILGSYERMLQLFEKHHPEYWDLAQPKNEELPSAVDDAAEVMSTPDPLAALRASTTEK